MSTQEQTSPLLDEFRFYLDHQADLVEKYNGKVIVIQGNNVLGAYDSHGEAIA